MVVFFDIDGTIVDERTQAIPASCIRAVEKLKENGHIAVINTGRPYSHIDPRVQSMAFRGWSCGCGMEVLLDDKWLNRMHPDYDLRWKAIRAARKYNMRPCYETTDCAILLDGKQSENKYFSWNESIKLGREFAIRQIADHPEADFLKLIVFSQEDSDPQGYIRELEDDFTIIDRGGFWLELVMKGCSKAQGMQLILDQLGVGPEDALAIGDSTNDLPMFQLAKHTVCMGNGMEEVKAVSEYITASVMEDGVEKALQHYGLI